MKVGVGLIKLLIISVMLFFSGMSRAGIDNPGKATAVVLQEYGLIDTPDQLIAFNRLLATVARRQTKYKSQEDFVAYVFYTTHRKLLKTYDEYPSLQETLTEGRYDCLTAVAVYALLFDELNIDYTLVETNYHTFILVNPGSEREILLETTDAHGGFVVGREAIAERIDQYRTDNNKLLPNQVDWQMSIFKELSLSELIGLLYYNQSIRHLNKGNYTEAAMLAGQATRYYRGERLNKLLNYMASL